MTPKNGKSYIVKNLHGKEVVATYESLGSSGNALWSVRGGGYLLPMDVDNSEIKEGGWSRQRN